MNKFLGVVKSHTTAAWVIAISVSCAIVCGNRLLQAQSPVTTTTAAQADQALLADFRHVEVASVSDALEQLTGKRMYMSHHMHALFTTKFAGLARTVLLKKDEGNTDPNALSGMLEAIDQGSIDSVYVMVVEDGADIAGMGGLMGTAMAARGYTGAVIDGGVRDVAYLRKIGVAGDRAEPNCASMRFPSIGRPIVVTAAAHITDWGTTQREWNRRGTPQNP